ncbi:MAG TPA: LuxR C-terminal-related transcriptional regulator [Actinoplanes sp.]|nr:LuxR C-terminal-related transcriptional regulator [Actinoplanes sp.]
MPALQEQYERLAGSPGDDQRVRVVDPRESTQLAADLLSRARDEVLVFHPTATSDLPFDAVTDGGPITDRLRGRQVRVRCVFAKEFLDGAHANDLLEQYTQFDFNLRAVHALPAAMMIVDCHTGLISLDGETPYAVLFRHSAAVGLLRAAFELHWESSVPLDTGGSIGPGSPSHTQLLILRLMAAGLKDESIARHLKVSLRTVRRNITTLCERAAVPTRFALATQAVQRGWLSTASSHEPPVMRGGRPDARISMLGTGLGTAKGSGEGTR